MAAEFAGNLVDAGTRISRGAANEFESPSAPTSSRQVPCHICNQKRSHGKYQDGREVKLLQTGKCAGGDQKQICRYRQTGLTAKYRNEECPISMPGKKLN